MKISDLKGLINSLAKLPANKETEGEIEKQAEKVAKFIKKIDWTKLGVDDADDLSKAGTLLHDQTDVRFKEVQKEFSKLESHLPKGNLAAAQREFLNMSTKHIGPQELSDVHKKYGKNVLHFLMHDQKFALSFAKNCAKYTPDFLLGLSPDHMSELTGEELIQVGAQIENLENQKAFCDKWGVSLDAVKKARTEL